MRIVKLILIAFLCMPITAVFADTPINQPSVKPDDPFGALKTGEFNNPNCGDHRNKLDVSINSKSDFVNYIKNNLDIFGQQSEALYNFKDKTKGETDWDKVLASVTTETIGSRTVYVLHYQPFSGDSGPQTLKMTNDGYVERYGCSGV